jgi:hypothetical protein
VSWVRRTERPVPAHACAAPTVEWFVTLPAPPPLPSGVGGGGKPHRVKFRDRPDGERNDLWRCDDCGRLWRIGEPDRPAGGYVGGGLEWMPATWWQRWRNR